MEPSHGYGISEDTACFASLWFWFASVWLLRPGISTGAKIKGGAFGGRKIDRQTDRQTDSEQT